MGLKTSNEKESGHLNKLVLVGNGFDLAHGLKTSYNDFLNWYMCQAFNNCCNENCYTDLLMEIKKTDSAMTSDISQEPKTFQEVSDLTKAGQPQSLEYKSKFFFRLLEHLKANNWVDIERFYFQFMKEYFSNRNLVHRENIVRQLNKEFDYLISKLSIYLKTVNNVISEASRLEVIPSENNFNTLFECDDDTSRIKFLNFNYTETLSAKKYAKESDVIHIHGRIEDIDRNPIIFGYGDETDPTYQKIEDSGENVYLEHVKSFGYFRTGNYHELISYIDTAPFSAHIIGHSCGLSDRVLLNEIFEHRNCEKIEVFYHVRPDGRDNFKEITQEISRHFRPDNKRIMRRKLIEKNKKNFIPQNKTSV